MPLLPNKVSHKNIATLGDADTEQIYEHNHVVAISTCGQRFVTDLINKQLTEIEIGFYDNKVKEKINTVKVDIFKD